MSNSSPALAPATAMPIFAKGARVIWHGISATVVYGNGADSWSPDRPIVSLLLDRPVARGYAPYTDAYATDVRAVRDA